MIRRARARSTLDPARRAAFTALRRVVDGDAYLNLTLPQLISEYGLGDRDAAFATELANGAARLQGRYDAMLDVCVDGGPATLETPVRVALRMGCHQLFAMRVPPHAAITTSVELVREAAGERPVRLVNAVLRRIGGRPLEAWLADMTFTQRWSHPAWVVEAFGDALAADDPDPDPDDLVALLEADNTSPTVTLAARPGLAEIADLAPLGVEPGRFSPYAGRLSGGAPAALAEVRSGVVGVQDEGSQLAALALTRARVDGGDTRWLDLCAGPGGKAALLAGIARQRNGVLVAADRTPHRARLVRQAMRGYPPPYPVVVADGTRPPWTSASFDRVLVDAPCSGLGALRRRPEARWRRSPADLETLVPLQRGLLESAVALVRPGGVVGYVTCSPHVAETREVVEATIRGCSDVVLDDARPLLAPVDRLGAGPYAQLWPHRHGTDAMFVAILRRVVDR